MTETANPGEESARDVAMRVEERQTSSMPAAPPGGDRLVDPRLVKAWCMASLFWMVLAPVFGLVAAMKLDDPLFLDNVHWLQFGRLRIAHVNGVVLGLFSSALVGFMCYAVPKLTGRPLALPGLAWAGFAFFNVAVFVGEGCLLAGVLQGLEVAEYPAFVDVILLAGAFCVAATFLATIANRRVDRLYVSLYYWIAGLLWTGINLTLGTFLMPNAMTGASHAALHGFYLHNIVGLWITPMGLGIVYYIVPAATRARLYSHKLSLIGFWALAFFYPLNGVHHYIFSPIADWAQTIAIASSMMLIIPVWAFSANMWGTMRGHWKKYSGAGSYALKFGILGAVWYLVTCFQGPLEALRSMQALTHFTDFVIGHSHSSVYGAFAIWAMAAIYFVLPRALGRELWSVRLASWHYWLQIFGFTLMFAVLTLSGFIQGAMLQTNDPQWIQTVNAIKPYWVARSIGGTLMDLGLALFVYNMVMTAFLGRSTDPDIGYGPAPLPPPALPEEA